MTWADAVHAHSAVVVIVSTPVPPLAAIVDEARARDGAHLTGDGAVIVAELVVHDAAVKTSNSATSCTRLAKRPIAGPGDVRASPSNIGLIQYQNATVD